ncbi:(2Fe-2S)-binding protein [Aquabacter sp. L1I39]|uniref:(2Fe-2S)-binding protein n=1 Tax=Aquabacter sp. L1I39 TaxID=2820278 RepID=UPI001ADD333A|nr:(2Fe-2S)-binding protein [Aquabacter sp. L1I39]QTL01780.1 (2Fe-2S)-binding protein [Aquabacter sp. L1I39]
MTKISLTVNGRAVTAEVEPRTLLVQFLREKLLLTGTHVGCDTSQCGACVVHVDGASVKSCTMLAVQADGASVTTIEGVANGAQLHPMQAAFREHHGLQCGFCTPGMIMTALDIVARHGTAVDEATIRENLDGNLCRCTGYHNIVKAIEAGARAMGGATLTVAAE